MPARVRAVTSALSRLVIETFENGEFGSTPVETAMLPSSPSISIPSNP